MTWPVQGTDHSVHTSPLHRLTDVSLDEHLDQHRQRVQGRADAGEDQHDREDLAGTVQPFHLAEADRRDRRHGLIDGVEDPEPEQRRSRLFRRRRRRRARRRPAAHCAYGGRARDRSPLLTSCSNGANRLTIAEQPGVGRKSLRNREPDERSAQRPRSPPGAGALEIAPSPSRHQRASLPWVRRDDLVSTTVMAGRPPNPGQASHR